MEDLLNEKELAAKLKVSVAALRRWRLEGRGPRVTKVERLVRYREADVALYLAGRTAGGQEPTRAR